jgi:hypothetical protein
VICSWNCFKLINSMDMLNLLAVYPSAKKQINTKYTLSQHSHVALHINIALPEFWNPYNSQYHKMCLNISFESWSGLGHVMFVQWTARDPCSGWLTAASLPSMHLLQQSEMVCVHHQRPIKCQHVNRLMAWRLSVLFCTHSHGLP